MLEREFVLVKVKGDGDKCFEVLCFVDVFKVMVIDVIIDYFVFEIIGCMFKIE